MSFDTTVVNSGLRNGACIILDQNKDKEMVWFACRNHIMEMMLKTVVVHAIEYSSGPDILLFKTFKNVWNTVQLEHFVTIIFYAFTLNQINNISTHTITFALKQLENILKNY